MTSRRDAAWVFDAPALAAVAAGGGLGALTRHLLVVALPWHSAAVVLGINVLGCFLMGVLVVAARDRHRLLRPFLGTGMLGGFTTVSTYAVTTLTMGDLALVHLLVTPLLAVAAAGAGSAMARGAERR